MRVVETIDYQYNELSEKAKEKAREWYLNYCSDFDSDYTIDDSKEIASLFGLDIEKISYSGFCSQGDGACFIGSYSYKKGALKAVKKYAPNDEELHRIVKELQVVQSKNFYRIRATTSHRGHYYYAYNMPVEVYDEDNQYRDLGKYEEEITQLLRDYADWIYSRLNSEYESSRTEESIIEAMEANEYEFDENGKRI